MLQSIGGKASMVSSMMAVGGMWDGHLVMRKSLFWYVLNEIDTKSYFSGLFFLSNDVYRQLTRRLTV